MLGPIAQFSVSFMLALLLRFTYLSQLATGAVLGWFWPWVEPKAVAVALTAVALPLLLHTLTIGIEVWLSRRQRPSTSQPAIASFLAGLRLFWAEWRVSLKIFMFRQTGRPRHPGVALPGLPAQRSRATAAPPAVLLIHGYLCNHRVWDELVSELRSRGHTVMAIDLEPLLTSIDTYAGVIEAAASALCAASGSEKIALVGHSMGGLAIRAWMRAHGTDKVLRVVTLGTPHRGTRLAALSHTRNGRQMVWDSDWLRQLAQSEDHSTRGLMHLLVSDADNMVYPQDQQALSGCTLTTVNNLGHLELLFNPDVVAWLCKTLAPDRAAQADDHKADDQGLLTRRDESAHADQPRPNTLGELFWAFAWIALQGFGGVLSVVQRELVERKKWLTPAQFVEDWSVSQILPGPNVVNLALMMGDRYFGWRGGLAATAGIIGLPMLLVLSLGVAFAGVADVAQVRGALRGMGAVAAGLIAANGLKLMTSFRGNVLGLRLAYAMALLTFCAAAFVRLPLLWILLGIGGLSGTLAYFRLRLKPHDSPAR